MPPMTNFEIVLQPIVRPKTQNRKILNYWRLVRVGHRYRAALRRDDRSSQPQMTSIRSIGTDRFDFSFRKTDFFQRVSLSYVMMLRIAWPLFRSCFLRIGHEGCAARRIRARRDCPSQHCPSALGMCRTWCQAGMQDPTFPWHSLPLKSVSAFMHHLPINIKNTIRIEWYHRCQLIFESHTIIGLNINTHDFEDGKLCLCLWPWCSQIHYPNMTNLCLYLNIKDNLQNRSLVRLGRWQAQAVVLGC